MNILRLAVLLIAFAAISCGARRNLSRLDQGCVQHCEEFWEQCRWSCPNDLGGHTSCVIARCNGPYHNCLDRCPALEDSRSGRLPPERRIELLGTLRDKGLLTEEEYQRDRQKILEGQ